MNYLPETHKVALILTHHCYLFRQLFCRQASKFLSFDKLFQVGICKKLIGQEVLASLASG